MSAAGKIARSVILATAWWAMAGAARAEIDADAMARTVMIQRDSYGVPHIEGPTDASVVFALGYAQAEDNFPHLEDNFIRALGRAAEVHGRPALLDDQMVAALDIVALAQAEYARTPARMRRLYDAYAAGLNYYVARHPEEPHALLTRFESWFPLALIRYKYHLLEFVGYAGLDTANYRPVVTPAPPERPQGSNAWAIAPSRSTSGAAMLLINPHIGFYGVAQYYEAHLISGEGWNFSGVGRYGFPFPYMGHSEALGWAHTDNYPDIGDLYIEHFDDPARPLAYRYGRGWRTAHETRHEIGVRGPDGALTRESFQVRRTHHGPIVSSLDGQPLSIRLSMLREGGWFDQWYAMSKARNFAQFRRALERGAVPYMNVVYADRDGNIFYAYNGAVPRRRAGFDYLRPVDGADPRTEWQGYHRFRELPQVLNPESGFVQNTNSSPFVTTSGDDNPREADFPRYMIGPEEFNPRARVSRDILENKRLFSFEDWSEAATDTRVWEARRLIPELRAAMAGAEPALAARVEPVMQALEAWDQIGATDSVAMTVFVRWYIKMRRARMPTDGAARLALLDDTRAELERAHGDWRLPWGEANRLQRRHWNGAQAPDDGALSLPVRGGPGWVGVVFNFYTGAPNERGRAYGVMGNSYVSVVEFAAEPQARSIVYFGQSGRPESAHYFDQAPLYARGDFKDAPTTRAQVSAAAVRRYHPGE
jgi:acyl-homoserine lactone acylase PvdQ